MSASGLGRALYHAWYRPVGRIHESMREGGPIEQWRTRRGRMEMEAAARVLPAGPNASGQPIELHVLTGRRFWFQSIFCLWSLEKSARRPLAPVIYDDGTLGEERREPFSRLFPAVRFVGVREITERLDTVLPPDRFPLLRDRWIHYPHIRKLTDVHAGLDGWKLVVDSDLLFFRYPGVLVDWLDAPAAPLHAVDCETSYGYSRALLESVAGRPLADRVNVGLTGLSGTDFDWERLEAWCRTILGREGTHYYLEQALVAMLVAGRTCVVAPAEDYVTRPRPPEVDACRAVMHHYVADSKVSYFRRNWRHVMEASHA